MKTIRAEGTIESDAAPIFVEQRSLLALAALELGIDGDDVRAYLEWAQANQRRLEVEVSQ